jgi:trans-aconitate 2-methyltransferase
VRFVHANLLSVTAADLGDAAPADAVFSTATFHWVVDHERLFANLAAVLRPGGRLVAQCGARGNVEGLSAVIRGLGVERPGSWYYASADETVVHLERAGFIDVQVWTNREPTPFDTPAELRDFLEAVCVREAVALMDDEQRERFLDAVVTRMPERVIDYVRLNILAVRGP